VERESIFGEELAILLTYETLAFCDWYDLAHDRRTARVGIPELCGEYEATKSLDAARVDL
jgi:hypothetical protein